MQQNHMGWLPPLQAAVQGLVNYVEDHWYVGRAGGSISLDLSVPQSNPLALGYAQWADKTRWAASQARYYGRQPIPIASARRTGSVWYEDRRLQRMSA